MGAVGKCNHCLPYLGFVSLHKNSYNHPLGIVVGLALLNGTRPAWYFGGDYGLLWAFTKLISFLSFVNVDS